MNTLKPFRGPSSSREKRPCYLEFPILTYMSVEHLGAFLHAHDDIFLLAATTFQCNPNDYARMKELFKREPIIVEKNRNVRVSYCSILNAENIAEHLPPIHTVGSNDAKTTPN